MVEHLEELLIEAFVRSSHSRQPMPSAVSDLLEQLKEYDLRTYEHSIRTGLKAKEIVDFTRLDAAGTLYGATLHDIGKLKVPKELLNKTSGYTPEDHEIMKRHTEFGYEILMNAGLPMTAGIARIHHCFQSRPYPEELPAAPAEINTPKGSSNLLFNARITALADQYDSAVHRINELNQNVQRTPKEVHQLLNEEFPDQMLFIDRLFKAGIFTGRACVPTYSPMIQKAAYGLSR